ncbi:MetQ/NlpA family ABC transporter substrate-binding protein [Nocardiopsis rhodophaea]|uniref:MetQ/NlpA family ABC transporter substrate-binding protein n=1 Tax=Nocardiopsis rhodophaea TaxID=280238 RepID=UPI0031D7D0E2
MRRTWGIIAATALATTLAACGSPSELAKDNGDTSDLTTIKVGASPVPHAKILHYVQENLAADAGLDIQVTEFTDYNQPNAALTQGEIDANYFQTKPFLQEYLDGNSDADLTWVDDVHLEAFGLYSESLEEIGDLADGAKIGVPNDASNMGRALKLLADNDLLTLKDGADSAATVEDIEDNPTNLDIVPVEAAQLPRSLADVDAAVVNGNYALEADLSESANVLAWEDTKDNPYANGLVVAADKADDPDIAKLDELLHSDEVRTYMEDQWKGVVTPIDADAE